MTQLHQLIADRALLPNGWHKNVLLEWDADGMLTGVTADAAEIAVAPRIAGTVLPGIANLHSHAFQRAMARNPDGRRYLKRIGFPAAHRLGGRMGVGQP